MSTTIRLKNSSALVSGKAKEPTPSDLAQGELAVNINKDDPSLFVKDSDGVVRKIAGSDAVGVEGQYLSIAADAEAQTVATTETTTFNGVVETVGGLKLSGGTAAAVNNGLFGGGGGSYIGFASQSSRIGRMEKYTGSDSKDAYRFSLDSNDDKFYKENGRTGISRGVNSSFELSSSGTFFFNQRSKSQQNISNYLCTSDDGEDGTVQASLSIRNSITTGGDIISNYFANLDAALQPRSVTLNLGAYASEDLANVPLKIGIGEKNTQITPDYIRIAGAFPDRDTSDDSYTQLAQNFVAIRGDFNTRFQTRGAGLFIKNLFIPDYLDEDDRVIPPADLPNPIGDGEGGFIYAQPEVAGIRIARMGHDDDFATNPITLSSLEGLRVDSDTSVFYNNNFPYSGDESDPGPTGVEQISGVSTSLNESSHPDRVHFNFNSSGTAPNFFAGSTYIGGTTSRSTRELWESTLTEEQQEQLAAGTLAIPANVSTPGDGSFVRQWWYDQQSAEDQALIDANELDYPDHFQAANFTDSFDLGESTKINLLSNGVGEFSSGVRVTGNSNAIDTGMTASGGVLRLTQNSEQAIIIRDTRINVQGRNFIFAANTDATENDASQKVINGTQCSFSKPPTKDADDNDLYLANGASSCNVTSAFDDVKFEGGFGCVKAAVNSASNTSVDHFWGYHADNSLGLFNAADADPTKKVTGYYTDLQQRTNKNIYAFYSARNAPSYFNGAVTGGGTNAASAVWSIDSTGTATGITVTRAAVVTDEQAGTVETLLDIINDLRQRVTDLEAG